MSTSVRTSKSKVTVTGMADAITEALQDYADVAGDEMKKAVTKAAKTVQKEIKSNAPRRSGQYAKSWKTKKNGETATGIGYTVYSPNRYQVAHLLEFGHAKRGGGRVAALPHIAKAEQSGKDQLLESLGRALR